MATVTRANGTAAALRSQSSVVAARRQRRATPVALDFQPLLRDACIECGETMDSLAAHLHLKDRGHVHRLLSGDKSLAVDRLEEFPLPVLQAFARRLAESFGLVVVVPADGPDAMKLFVSGLVGLLRPASKLPSKTSGPIKCELPESER